MELHEFLAARLDEDEQAARQASPGPWQWEGDFAERGDDEVTLVASNDENVLWAHGVHTDGYIRVREQDAEHIARHDPARVLREVEAKRALVDLWDDEPAWEMSGYEEHAGFSAGLGRALRLLAVVYADHPDYDPSWRP